MKIDIHTLFETLPDALYLINIRGEFVDINQAVTDALGYTKEEIKKLDFYDIVQDQLPGFEDLWYAVKKQGRMTFQSTHKRKDGYTFPVEVNVSTTEIHDEKFFWAIARNQTQTKQHEHDLREREQRFKTLFEEAPCGILIGELGGRILDCNHHTCKMLGVPYEKLKGAYAWEFFERFPQKRVQIIVERLKKETHFTVHNETITHTDNSTRLVDMSFSTIDQHGKSCVLVHITDVTERVDTTRALEKSLKLLTTLLETAPMPIFLKDHHGMYLTCNDAFANFIGKKKAEIIGKTVYDLAPPHLAKKYDIKDQQLLAKAGEQNYEEKVLSADGTLRDAHFAKASFLDHSGDIVGIVGLMLDITERKASEVALQKSESLYRDLTEDMPLMMSRYTKDGVITYVNKACSDFFNIPKASFVGLNLFTLYTSKEQTQLRNTLREITPKQPIGASELMYITPKGQQHWIRWIIRGIFDSKGTLTEYQGIGEDISMQKLTELKLHEAIHNAEQSNQAKSQFIAMVSHELRTPITPIVALSEALYQSCKDPEMRESIALMRKAGKNLLNLVQNILDISKIEAEKLDLAPMPCNIRALIEETLSVQEPSATQKQLKLKTLLGSDLPPSILLDYERFRQVLNNLINNAIKFTHEGEIILSCQVLEAKHTRAKLEIQITDTGIGLPPDRIPNLFEPFVQADISQSREYGGTGLGLSICSKLITLMGGTITAKNNAQGGACFTILIDVPIDQKQTNPQEETNTHQELKGKKILLVEDNESNQIAFFELMKQTQAHVDLARNGEIAIQKASQGHYDFIFMDIRLPRMNGYKATEMILKNASGKNTPQVIALTGDCTASVRQKCEQAGMRAFISKPFTLDSILETVHKIH